MFGLLRISSSLLIYSCCSLSFLLSFLLKKGPPVSLLHFSISSRRLSWLNSSRIFWSCSSYSAIFYSSSFNYFSCSSNSFRFFSCLSICLTKRRHLTHPERQFFLALFFSKNRPKMKSCFSAHCKYVISDAGKREDLQHGRQSDHWNSKHQCQHYVPEGFWHNR